MKAAVQPTQNQVVRWPQAFKWFTAISSLLYVLSRFLPCTHPWQYSVLDEIDDGWSQALHFDFANHLQFGRDVVFTYGPWGFLCRGYSAETHGIAMLAWTVLAVIFWVATWRLAEHFSNNRFIACAWVIAFSAFATLPLGDDINSRLVAWIVLPLMLHFFVDAGKFTPVQCALAAAWGLLCLTKFTGFIMASAVFALIGLDDLRRRRIPWGLPVLGTSMLLFWVLAQQQLSGFIPYVINSFRITAGYTDAMMTFRSGEITQVLYFLALATAIVTFAGVISWRQLKLRGALVVAALSVILFLVFKAGFVRMDMVHEVSTCLSVMLVAVAIVSVAWRNQARGSRMAGVILVLVCTLWASNFFLQNFRRLTFAKQALDTISPGSLMKPFQAAFTDRLVLEDLASRQLYRNQWPLPSVSGGSDLYTMYIHVLFAHGLKYTPRPVMQSYSAYSTELSDLNAAFLRSPAAPTNLFFSLGTIDSRYPTLDDSRSWPAILTHYDLKGMSCNNGQFLVMQRATHPRAYALEPVTNAITHFGASTSVPDTSNGPIWVEIDFAKSLSGKLQSFLYKPQGLTMTITTRDNGRHTFRVVQGMTRGGFLLSPCISNTESFGWFASTGGRTAPDEVTVTAISLGTDGGPNNCYEPEIVVRFYRLQFQPQQAVIAEQQQAPSR